VGAWGIPPTFDKSHHHTLKPILTSKKPLPNPWGVAPNPITMKKLKKLFYSHCCEGQMYISIGKKTYSLTCDKKDRLDIYYENKKVYVLFKDIGLEYIGLNIINLETNNQQAIFVTPTKKIKQLLGKMWFKRPPYNVIKILRNYIGPS
jgi:hypothetical protein